MTDEMRELGRRAVACPGWRWMPGMLTVGGIRIDVVADGRPVRIEGRAERVGLCGTDAPNLSDAATAGCLLALVREARGIPEWQPARLAPDAWLIDPVGSGAQAEHPSYAAVLVAALERAPS